RDLRDVDEREQQHHHRGHEPEHPAHGLLDADPGDLGRDHQVDRQGRGEPADGDHVGQDDPEPHGSPFVVPHERHQQRHEDQEDRDAVEHHAHAEQHDDDHRQRADLPEAAVGHEVHHRVDQPERVDRVGEDARQRDHHHDDAGYFGRVGEDVDDVAHPDGAMDHHAHEQAVDHGDHRGLGRREPT